MNSYIIAGGPTPLHRPPFSTNGFTPETAADTVAIQQLLARYSHLLDSDTSGAKQVAALFTPDGKVLPAYEGDAVYQGREAVEKWFASHADDGLVLRCDPVTGQVIARVHVPGAGAVTACAFGGPDLQDFYITTMRCRERLETQPNGGRVFHVRVPVAGQPEFSWKGMSQ